MNMRWEEMRGTPEGSTIELKGFLFQAVDGEWILSAESGLKACCVGRADKPHITLQGHFASHPTLKPLLVQGVLHSKEGRYFLANAQTVHTESYPWWTLSFLLVAALFLAIRRLRRLLP